MEGSDESERKKRARAERFGVSYVSKGKRQQRGGRGSGRNDGSLLTMRAITFAVVAAASAAAAGDADSSKCAAALGATCPKHYPRSAAGILMCDTCAGGHQTQLRAAGCDATEVQRWCATPSAACTPAGPEGVCSAPVCCAVCGPDPQDCTSGMQAALDSASGRTIVFQADINWVTQPLHITRNHSRLLFEPGAVVTAKSGAFKGVADCLFAAYITTNLTISGYGATWSMRRSDYNTTALYKHSGGRHGLQLMGCVDTVVEGLRIELTGGDGISVWKGHVLTRKGKEDQCADGSLTGLTNIDCACENLLIRDVVCDRNYRQGISIMLGENITVINSVFSNTAGTPPAFGVDLEPDHTTYRFVNVSFRNCSFIGNQGGGISINMATLDHTAPPLSISFEDIEVDGGTNLPWVNAPLPKGTMYDQTGIGLASHSRAGENSLGSVVLRNVRVRNTLGAGLIVLGKPGVGGEWVALIDNITLQNVATATHPTPSLPPKHPHPNNANAAPIIVAWIDSDVVLPWDTSTCLPWVAHNTSHSCRTKSNIKKCVIPIIPACQRPIEAVGGLTIRAATIIDDRPRSFISTGSPTLERFPNGSSAGLPRRFIDLMPRVIANVSIHGTVVNSAPNAVAEVVCGGDLGPLNGTAGYAQRDISLAVSCRLKLDEAVFL